MLNRGPAIMTKIAIGQICSTVNIQNNLSQCLVATQKAAKAGAKVLFLPEASDYIASSAAESVSLALPVKESPFVLGLQKAAKEHEIAINVGIHEPADGGTRLKNTLLWIDEAGGIAQRYQKVHLFDVDIENGPTLRESNSVEPGTSLSTPFATVVGRIGMLICFDLRFPEPALRLVQSSPSATLLTYPSAFTIPTGKAHWSPLLRARAIENQAFVVASAQVGQHNDKRASYGHSMVIDPWGEVLVEMDGEWTGEPEVQFCDIDESRITWARGQVPLNRRWDVYGRC